MMRSALSRLKFLPRLRKKAVEPVTDETQGPTGKATNPVHKRLRLLRRRLHVKRTRWSDLTFTRLLLGGRPSDAGRLWRYVLVFSMFVAMAWLPAIAYVKFTKPKFTSNFALILPGAGSSSSVSLADIGQASSASASAYSSPSISPTVTYKNLLMSANVIDTAAAQLKVDAESLPVPVIKLVDETSFIKVEMTGGSPEEARNRALAVQEAFSTELNKLRDDEIKRREASVTETIKGYEKQVNAVREKISSLQSQTELHSLDQYNALVTATDQLKSKVAEGEAMLAKDLRSIAALSDTLHLTPADAALAMKLHADPQFTLLAEATGRAQSEFAQAGEQFGSSHPLVVAARTHFNGVQAQMMARASKITGVQAAKLVGKLDMSPLGQRSTLMSQLVNLNTESEGLKGQLSAQKAELESNRQKVTDFVDTAAQMDRLNRDYKLAEAVFASAMARINTSKADIFASYPMVQVIAAPMKPLLPSSPDKKLAMIGAAASTFLLLVGAALGWLRRPLIERLLRSRRRRT